MIFRPLEITLPEAFGIIGDARETARGKRNMRINLSRHDLKASLKPGAGTKFRPTPRQHCKIIGDKRLRVCAMAQTYRNQSSHGLEEESEAAH